MQKEGKLYSKGEEIFNGVSHIVGAGLGVIFLVILIIQGIVSNLDGISLLSLIIFGVSMILLYTMSSLYHMISAPKGKKILRIFDHCTIFVLIAGTYTPYIILCLNNLEGYLILGFVWLLAIIGITLNAINMHNKYVKIYSYIAYLLMGWCIIFAFPSIITTLSKIEFWLLLLGGVFYTSGLVFYFGGRKKKWWHSIWHLFDLIGTILQFLSIYLIILF